MLFFAALMLTLGVKAQTASDYYTFEAEVLLDASQRLTSQASLTAGKHIVIQHCHEGTAHEGHEGAYISFYSLATNGKHKVYMQENPVGLVIFTTQAGAVANRFKLQTSHMRCKENAHACYLQEPDQTGELSAGNTSFDFQFKYVSDGKWQIVVPGYSSSGDSYLWVDTEAGKNPAIGVFTKAYGVNTEKQQAQSYFYVYEVNPATDTRGVIQYVTNATVRLTGPSGNQITTTHTGWSDFYEFTMYSWERYNGTNYGISISNVLYHSDANLITADISYPFAISGDVAKVPVHLCPNGEINRLAVVDGTLKTLNKNTASAELWTKNNGNQWYIYPKYVVGATVGENDFSYAIQNVATKQYLRYSSETGSISLYEASDDATVATLPDDCFFKLNGNPDGSQIYFMFEKWYANNGRYYDHYLYGNGDNVSSSSSTYTTGTKFTVPNVVATELDGVPSIGFTRYFHEDTYFWDGGVIPTANVPNSVKAVLKYASHEDRDNGTHNVYTATTGITVTHPGQVNATFNFTSGNNALQVLGVDIVTAEGQLISSDYHAGKAGNPSQNNQYILTNVAAGAYYLRYWVCSYTKTEYEGHDLAKVRGRIEVQGANYRWIPATTLDTETATWYRMRLSDGLERYISAQAGYVDDNNNLLLSNNTPPADYAGLWTMVGNKTDGYKFYNYTAGAEYALKTDGEGANARTYLAPVAEASLYDVVQQDGNYQFFVKLHGTDNYLYKQGEYLATSANALGDANAVLSIETVNSTTWTNEEIEIGGGDDENSEEYIWRYSTSVSLGERITDVASLTDGQKVVFKNVGQNNYITIHRGTLKANAQATANGLSVFTVHKVGDNFTFESARPGYYFPTIGNSGWPGYYMTTTAHEFVVRTTHADATAAGEGRFVIKDATQNAYFDGNSTEFTGWQGNGNNSKFEIYPVTSMGDEYHSLVLRTAEITDNLDYLHTGSVGVWSDNNEVGMVAGYYAEEKNLTFADNKVTGTVNFKTFPVSSLDANPNMVLVSSYPNNYALFYWRANGDNIETEKNAKPNVSNLDAYAWAIYPKLESDGFKFYLQNVATGNYLTSTQTANSHAAGDITLSENGTGFTVEANDKFKFVTGMYISTDSSNPSSSVQSLGVYNSGHIGTQNRIHSFVDVVKESLVKTGVGYPAITSTEYQNVATLDGTEGFETVKSRFDAYYNCENVQMPESGKAYVFTNVHSAGGKKYLNYAESGLTMVARGDGAANDLPESAKWYCRMMESGQYVFVNSAGKYLVFKGFNDGTNSNKGYVDAYDETYSPITFVKMTTSDYTGSTKLEDLFGYVAFGGRRKTNEYSAYFVTTSGGGFQQDSGWTLRYDNSYSTAFIVEEVTNYPFANTKLTETSKEEDTLLKGIEDGQTVSTFSAPYATVIPAGVTAYYAKKASQGETLYLTAVESDKALPACQGVILIGNVDVTTGNFVPATTETPADLSANVLKNTAKGDVDAGDNDYALAKGGEGIGIYKVKEKTKIKAGKAYLHFDTPSQARSFVLSFSGAPTAIEDSLTDTADAERPVIYDLYGRRVNETIKGGIYIVNGKKVIIK